MAATAVHLTDHVIPRLPAPQWVLAVPKRLRVFVRRGLLPGDDARAMGRWAHGGGFSSDGPLLLTPWR